MGTDIFHALETQAPQPTQDAADEKRKQARSREFVKMINSLFRLATIYDTNNRTFLNPLERFVKILKGHLEEKGVVDFDSMDNYLVINGEVVYTDFQTFSAYQSIMEEFKKRNMRGISFHGSDIERLKAFFTLFARADLNVEDIFEALKKKLAEAQMTEIEIFKTGKMISQQDAREMSFKVFTESLNFVKDAIKKFGTTEEKNIKIKDAKRIVQKTIDLIVQDPVSLLGLSTLKNHDEYTAVHSVNVAILSIVFGLRLGFDKKSLGELGMAALFHDLGKNEVPLSILNKPGPLTDSEWDIMQKHTIYGSLGLLKTRLFNKANLVRIIGGYEHHVKHDFTGYPKFLKKKELSIIGEIIHVTDSYDAMTTSRVYALKPFIPAMAIQRLIELSGTSFDPVLIKAFAVTMGAYPPPSLVQLNTKELGVVVRPNPDPRLIYEPEILLISDPRGKKIAPVSLDLANQPEGENGRRILGALNHYDYGINVHKYLLSYQGLAKEEGEGQS